jgi:hypothetical protein
MVDSRKVDDKQEGIMMKRVKYLAIIAVMVLIGFSGSVRANEFNGYSYNLNYPAPVGSFGLFLELPGLTWDYEINLPLIQDMPGQYLNDALGHYCTPGDPEFDPQKCAMLQIILNSEAIDWLNDQWNENIASLTSVLPYNVTTRQLPWPLDTMGTLIIHDYGFEWPCSWNTATGSFSLLPIHVETDESPNEGVSVSRIYDFHGNGQIERSAEFRIDGLFDYSIETQINAGDATVGLTIGLIGEYTAF